jgi:hypothetical protein
MLGFSVGDIMRISINAAHTQKTFGFAAAVILRSSKGFRDRGLVGAKYFQVDSNFSVSVTPGATIQRAWPHLSPKNLAQGKPGINFR